tara:strand:- start:1493 stop:1858 length:366 start_codon:yes stop_codon:yes gene_type:complete
MALQKTITTENGLDVTYWRITNSNQVWDGASFQFNFTMQGYKDSEYRVKDASPMGLNFRPIISYTGDANSWNAVQSNVLQNTSGDLRPALYNWVKTQTGWNDNNQLGGSVGPIDWSNASNV